MLAGNAKRIFCDNVTVICMAPRVPTAGLCPRILFRMVTRSLGCFCRALGCCVRRLTTLAISAFIFPCPKILYARDSFRHFPLATHCTACTQNHWSCNPRQAAPQKAIQGSMRNMQGSMRICWLFGLPSTQKLCTNQPHVLCPCSNLSAWRDPFSSKTLSVESQATNGKKSHLLILASSFAGRSTWIVKMTTTLWERCNSLIFPDSGLCNDLELLEQGTPSQMQWYSVPFHHQNI